MKVVILCGGKGTRLREETEFRPKPMLPIGGRPILWHIMKIYANYGLTDFVLCLGHKGDIIKDYFRNYLWHTSDVTLRLGTHENEVFHNRQDEHGWTVTLAETGEETLTAGRIAKVRKYIGDDEHFFLTYGDGVGDVDVRACYENHLASGKILTMTTVHPPGRFGEVALTAGGEVTSFNEKPQTEEGWINGGFFCASSRLFAYLDDSEDMLLEKQPMQRLAAEGQLNAYPHTGFWQPMDTFQEFTRLNELWDSGRAPWKLW
jgi:glucose-1-phosphate cytidylyltransferase